MEQYDIIDNVDPFHVDKELTIIPSAIERVIIVRVNDDGIGSTYGLLLHKRREGHGTQKNQKAVLLKAGRLNFSGGAGGMMNLDGLQKWLEDNNLLDKVDSVMRQTTQATYQKVCDSDLFDTADYVAGYDFHAQSAETRFQAWRRGDRDWRQAGLKP